MNGVRLDKSSVQAIVRKLRSIPASDRSGPTPQRAASDGFLAEIMGVLGGFYTWKRILFTAGAFVDWSGSVAGDNAVCVEEFEPDAEAATVQAGAIVWMSILAKDGDGNIVHWFSRTPAPLGGVDGDNIWTSTVVDGPGGPTINGTLYHIGPPLFDPMATPDLNYPDPPGVAGIVYVETGTTTLSYLPPYFDIRGHFGRLAPEEDAIDLFTLTAGDLWIEVTVDGTSWVLTHGDPGVTFSQSLTISDFFIQTGINPTLSVQGVKIDCDVKGHRNGLSEAIPLTLDLIGDLYTSTCF